MGKRKNEKQVNELLRLVGKLDAMEFFGLLRMFNIPMVTLEGKPREFKILMEEFLKNFLDMDNGKRKNLLTIVRAAAEGK